MLLYHVLLQGECGNVAHVAHERAREEPASRVRVPAMRKGGAGGARTRKGMAYVSMCSGFSVESTGGSTGSVLRIIRLPPLPGRKYTEAKNKTNH
jgi:hypothetical protein